MKNSLLWYTYQKHLYHSSYLTSFHYFVSHWSAFCSPKDKLTIQVISNSRFSNMLRVGLHLLTRKAITGNYKTGIAGEGTYLPKIIGWMPLLHWLLENEIF